MDRINTYWLEEYQVDGFRFDYTKGMTNAGNVSNNAQRITYLKRLADTVWAVNPSAYVILEHWADNAEEKQLADYGMMLWGNTCHQFYEGAMGFPTTSNFSWASYKNRTWNQPGLITYLDSHDEERIAFKVKVLGRQSNPNYPVRSLEISLRRLELASALGHLIPGPKMIYMFTELGYDQSIDNPCRICNKPPRWNYQQVPERKRLYDVTAELLKLKTTYPVFSTSNYQIQEN
jgi:pullulanase/glycogen debranching enzyme